MGARSSAASEDSSHGGSIFSATSHTSATSYNTKTAGGGLDLCASSHSIAKNAAKKKGPIIRVVHVFAPTLIKTDVENFRTLVQKLTGNQTSNEVDDHQQEQATIKHTQQLELRHQKKNEATMPANYSSPAVSSLSEALSKQFEEQYDEKVLSRGFLQAELASGYAGLAMSGDQSIAYLPRLARISEELEGHWLANYLPREEAAINYFHVPNYCINDGNYYDPDSPSSLDGSSSSSSGSIRGGSVKQETEKEYSVFHNELDSMEGDFHSSYPFMGLDDQQCLAMSMLDTKLDWFA